jgi:hypothetical protein
VIFEDPGFKVSLSLIEVLAEFPRIRGLYDQISVFVPATGENRYLIIAWQGFSLPVNGIDYLAPQLNILNLDYLHKCRHIPSLL